MNKKQENLIEYLEKKKKPITAKELSAFLDISVRTVRNYVALINNEAEQNLILPTPHGYELNVAKYQQLVGDSNRLKKLPQNYEERSNYINKLFLLNHIDKLDIYDLSEELYVSIQTIKSDINRMNKSFSNFNIKYCLKGDSISINASEKDIRRLARYTLFDGENKGSIDYSVLQSTLKDIDVETLKNVVQDIFSKYDLYLNDFSKANMVLHLAIIIERVKANNFITLNNDLVLDEMIFEFQAMKDLCFEIEDKFNIELNHQEKNNVYLLLQSCANISLQTNISEIYNYVGEEIIVLIKNIISGINEFYYIDLDTEKFILPFSLHIKNLLLRVQNDKTAINPMCEAIRFTSPLIFDIAVFSSSLIEKNYNIKIDENEIAYLALHIGGEIDRQAITEEKLKAVFLCPKYLSYEAKIYNFLLLNFSNEIEFIESCSSMDEVSRSDFHLLISTLPISKSQNYPFEICEISMFLNRNDRYKIEQVIDQVKDKMSISVLHDRFDSVFDEELFFIQKNNQAENNKYTIMKKMADRMIDKGYVENDFFVRIVERDEAMSTAFPNIAIPHSMKMDAIKTSINVMLCPNGIQWDDQRIYVIFVVAIHKIDCLIFREIYESLVKLFSDEQSIRYLISSQNFTDFREKILYLTK